MKNVVPTEKIKTLLTREVGKDVDLNNLSVFEATAINQLPIRKEHPIYKGAIVEKETMGEMAQAISQESIPLYIMHKDNDNLPVGRAFYGEIVDDELRTLFFVPRSEEKVLDLINTGVVNQVSVGALFKGLICSECGFDFRGEDATLENVLTGTCPNGHVMGKSAHVKLKGLDKWNELSLVGRGAVINAKIHGRDNSKLAANESINNLFYLCAAPTDKETVHMEALQTLLAEFKNEMLKLLEESQSQVKTVQDLLATAIQNQEKILASKPATTALTAAIDNAKNTLVSEEVPTTPVSDPANKVTKLPRRPVSAAFKIKQ